MNTKDVTVSGLRFSPDSEPQVIGNSKFAFMIENYAEYSVGELAVQPLSRDAFLNSNEPIETMDRDDDE